MLENHGSVQIEIIMKEGKDDREVIRKEKVGTRVKEEEKVNQQLQSESNQQ